MYMQRAPGTTSTSACMVQRRMVLLVGFDGAGHSHMWPGKACCMFHVAPAAVGECKACGYHMFGRARNFRRMPNFCHTLKALAGMQSMHMLDW